MKDLEGLDTCETISKRLYVYVVKVLSINKYITMNLRKTKLYKTVVSGSPDAVMKSLWEYLKSGKDVNLRDEETSGTLLHLLVEYGERFCEPDTIQAIYMMVCKDIEIDALDNKGETALHKVMRKKGTYRIMMAIIRFVYQSF